MRARRTPARRLRTKVRRKKAAPAKTQGGFLVSFRNRTRQWAYFKRPNAGECAGVANCYLICERRG